MDLHFVVLASVLLLAVALVQPAVSTLPAYIEYDPAAAAAGDDEYGGEYNRMGIFNSEQKRACVPRGGNCDHRPNDCCFSTSCRCNLWGANCRCQRKGIPWLNK